MPRAKALMVRFKAGETLNADDSAYLEFTKANYDTHSPRRALGFQKLAQDAGATCFVKFPSHPADEAAKDIWDFLDKQLRP